MKRRIAVITGSRAEYGLLYWTLKELIIIEEIEVFLFVTGMHMSKKFGETYKEIEADGIAIYKKIDIGILNDSPLGISMSMGVCTSKFGEAFDELKPDILLVLGDRYEILSAVLAAIPFRIPIAHISGGEITEGAIDDQIRNCISKLAHLHFPGATEYAENLIKMGEEAWRVFNVGDPGIENIRRLEYIKKSIIFENIGLDESKKTLLVTLHPTTLNDIEIEKKESKVFFSTLAKFGELNIVITYPNADGNNEVIINEIEMLRGKNNIRVVKNLGRINYLSLMKYCDLVLGNSSSGIVEAPYMQVPTIDYGDRQKGRLMAKSVIHCEPNQVELKQAIERALYDGDFTKTVKENKGLYGDGDTAQKIVEVLKSVELGNKLLRKKQYSR